MQYKSNCADRSVRAAVQKDGLHRMVVVIIAFQSTRIIGRVQEIMFNAVYLIAELARFTPELRGVGRDSLKHLSVHLN